ncbi:hypothetical protein DLP05_076 [Stenotrophomonas phage vB_SmaS_DLP_5]|uniref:Uncharacterized protein n=1 Tax=Stenotrophomonas phage vB_SmaS_DLP_5 TaxID=2044561 RepID=A0A2D2W2M6_9CAUD|nr:hypothetical protein FDJ07_gp145 [Stenotrophomonas phage vB_SmaS_DLP_5]ATS92394.1 hypothetical protein DLP05_076 [Stenotrophomonas phage vB_SmaS_DLP_5]
MKTIALPSPKDFPNAKEFSMELARARWINSETGEARAVAYAEYMEARKVFEGTQNIAGKFEGMNGEFAVFSGVSL